MGKLFVQRKASPLPLVVAKEAKDELEINRRREGSEKCTEVSFRQCVFTSRDPEDKQDSNICQPRPLNGRTALEILSR